MSEAKRMAGPYEITHAIHIGDGEIVLGENPADTEGVPYMCAYCEANDIIASYYDSVGGEDYAEIVGIFGERIKEQAERTQEKLRQECMDGEQSILVTEKDCTLITSEDDLNNQVVVIRADVLRPEYRTASRQLRLCTGGFGASPHSRGSACYCKDLVTGKDSRFERRDILGVMEPDELPQWALAGLAAIEQAEKKLQGVSLEARRRETIMQFPCQGARTPARCFCSCLNGTCLSTL